VLGAGRHLLALINDILDPSKIEAGRMELHLETFSLVPVIKDVVQTIEPMATKSGNRLIIECPADLGTIHVDQTMSRRARITYSGLSGTPTAAHFHGPAQSGANAGVAVPIPNVATSPAQGSATLTDAQAADLLAGRYYINIHTAANPAGEIRGQVTK
jgi:hypothetical protein